MNSYELVGLESLREWCQTILSSYGITYRDWSSTWQDGRGNGILLVHLQLLAYLSLTAFAALLEYLSPNLIQFSELNPENAEENLKIVFEKSKSLGMSFELHY